MPVHGPKPTRDDPTVEHVVLEHAKVGNKHSARAADDGFVLRARAKGNMVRPVRLRLRKTRTITTLSRM